MTAAIKKTLIFRLSSIGDIVLTTPFIRLWHAKYPAVEIEFAVRKEYADLLRYHPAISRLHEIDVSEGREGLIRWRSYFQKQNFDSVFDLHNNFRTKFMRSGLDVPAHVIDKRTVQRWILVKTKLNLFRQIIPVAERYIEAAKSCGIKPDREGAELFVPQQISDRVREKIASRFGTETKSIVAICPGSKHFTKRWPVEFYSALTKRILETATAVILLGGTEDKSLADIIMRSAGDSLYNACEEFSLLETVAAIDQCKAVVSNDSGLMHIACARKKPVISIFGSSVKEFGFFPYHADSKIFEVDGLRCRPCSHIGRDSCPKQHFQCMKKIEPDMIFDELSALLRG